MRTAMMFPAILLCGCAPMGSVESFKPVCDALIGPISYSSTNKASQSYAAPKLAPQLKRRNQVGQKLNCPLYKKAP